MNIDIIQLDQQNQAENLRSKWKTIKMAPIIHVWRLVLDSTRIARTVMRLKSKKPAQFQFLNITFPGMF